MPAGDSYPLVSPRALARIASGLLVVLWALLAFRSAQRIDLQYWDGDEYLQNARVLAAREAGDPSLRFHPIRPPLLPALLAPLVDGGAPLDAAAERRVRFACAALSVLSVWLVLVWFAVALRPWPAAAASILVLLDPLGLHLASFAMTDLLATGLAALAAAVHWHTRERGGAPGVAALALVLALGLLAKYSFVVVVAALAVAELLRARAAGAAGPGRYRPLARLLAASAAAGALAALTLLLYLRAGAAAASAPAGPAGALLGAFLAVAEAGDLDGPFEYVAGLAARHGVPIAFAALLGAVLAARRREPAQLLHLAWLAVALVALSTVVRHKEARYLLPALPAFAALAGEGLEAVFLALRGRLARRLGPRLAAGTAAAVVVASCVPAARAARAEVARLADPVYATGLARRLVEPLRAAQARGAAVVLAPGFTVTLFPRAPRSVPGDDYLHFHHLSANSLRLRSGLDVRALDELPEALDRLGESGAAGCLPETVEACDKLFLRLFDGPALWVWSNDYADGATEPLPPRPAPVELAEVAIRRHQRPSGAPATGVALGGGWRTYCATARAGAPPRLDPIASGAPCAGQLLSVRTRRRTLPLTP